MSETAQTEPTLAIRAKPPSPKRLSRKVLLAGAIAMSAIVVLALVLGLSERPDRAAGAAETRAAASGPPETIALGPSQYGASDLISVEGETLAPEAEALELAPPLEPPRGAAANAMPTAPDPETIAAAAPIVFGGNSQASARARVGEFRLERRLEPPRSAYELIAGSVIPAALLTELVSDRPGRVIAQVSAPVYDSVRGEHLLIPQGARLIGAYEGANTYGDQRLMLVWQRLIFPNGWSIALENMEGAGPSGAAGLRDRTDTHMDRIAGAALISAFLSIAANEAESEDEAGFARSVADAAAQEAASAGGRIVDRELSVRPTLRVRAGAPVRVLVTRDIRLRPYRE